jgi:hypothetical protein
VPGPRNETEEEEAKRPLGNRHAEHGKSLRDGLEERGVDSVLGAADVRRVLPEAVITRNCDENNVEKEQKLKVSGSASCAMQNFFHLKKKKIDALTKARL